MKPNPSVVLFLDVDGVLLDRASSFDAAVGALELVARQRIPLVFCSSKTRAQLELIYQELGVSHPFVCENGGAVFVPRGYFGFDVPHARDVAGYRAVEFGKPYAEVVGTLHRTAERLQIDVIGFSDMSVQEVATDCDLPLMQARLAKLREYDEPFRILEVDPSARRRLFKVLRAARLGCTTRGRYEHVGAPVDQAVGVGLLCTLFRRALGSVLTVGLGDGLHDVPLLRCVDVPLVARSDEMDVTPRLVSKLPKARLTSTSGIDGLADAIVRVVQRVRQTGGPDLSAQGDRP